MQRRTSPLRALPTLFVPARALPSRVISGWGRRPASQAVTVGGVALAERPAPVPAAAPPVPAPVLDPAPPVPAATPATPSEPPVDLPAFMVRRRPVPHAGRARRARRVIWLAAFGGLFAATGAVLTVTASWGLRRGGQDDALWLTLGNVASVVVLLAALMQLGLWCAAEREWAGRKDFNFAYWLPISTLAAWAGALAALVVAATAAHHSRGAGGWQWQGWLSLAGGAACVLGAVLGAVQRFRADPAPLLSRRQRRASKR
ncbi:hypothetical protein [Aestuariimicrobium ganziense]|uniref:hypothetical protein n=1 Tax=Aestuariimicrobium ganziense TaxID=2773677 RepID=UPI001941E2FA|nr:hypothetical protein [Aestuariimicrobium ganziense]